MGDWYIDFVKAGVSLQEWFLWVIWQEDNMDVVLGINGCLTSYKYHNFPQEWFI